MTISVKVPVLVGGVAQKLTDGTLVTKPASPPVKKIVIQFGKQAQERDGKIAELIGEAVYQRVTCKGVADNIATTLSLLEKTSPEAVVNVYHCGYDPKTLELKESETVKTHSLTVAEIRERLAGKDIKPILYNWVKELPKSKRGRSSANTNQPIIWEVS
jgi:hypothetical protein